MRRTDIDEHGRRRVWRIVPASAAALIVAVFGFASPAHAHVTVTPSTTAAGARAVLRFSVEHGCGDSPTTAVTIQIPPQVTSVTPTRTARWEIMVQSDAVTFNANTPLPDGVHEVVELAVQLPDAPGTTLYFPTIQRCGQAESAWIEVPRDGQDVGELPLPAPSFVVSEGATQQQGVLTYAVLAVGLLGSLLGGVALVRRRRRT